MFECVDASVTVMIIELSILGPERNREPTSTAEEVPFKCFVVVVVVVNQ